MSETWVKEHMEAIGADGVHIGTVDRVENGRIKLTKADSREGRHTPRSSPLVDTPLCDERCSRCHDGRRAVLKAGMTGRAALRAARQLLFLTAPQTLSALIRSS